MVEWSESFCLFPSLFLFSSVASSLPPFLNVCLFFLLYSTSLTSHTQTQTHTMLANLPHSFPNFLAVSPPIAVLPPLSSSSSSLSPNRCHPPLLETAPLLMALFDNIVRAKRSVIVFTSLSTIKLFLILLAVSTVIGLDSLSQSFVF